MIGINVFKYAIVYVVIADAIRSICQVKRKVLQTNYKDTLNDKSLIFQGKNSCQKHQIH